MIIRTVHSFNPALAGSIVETFYKNPRVITTIVSLNICFGTAGIIASSALWGKLSLIESSSIIILSTLILVHSLVALKILNETATFRNQIPDRKLRPALSPLEARMADLNKKARELDAAIEKFDAFIQSYPDLLDLVKKKMQEFAFGIAQVTFEDEPDATPLSKLQTKILLLEHRLQERKIFVQSHTDVAECIRRHLKESQQKWTQIVPKLAIQNL